MNGYKTLTELEYKDLAALKLLNCMTYSTHSLIDLLSTLDICATDSNTNIDVQRYVDHVYHVTQVLGKILR